jgi:hypothetical protein
MHKHEIRRELRLLGLDVLIIQRNVCGQNLTSVPRMSKAQVMWTLGPG